MNLAELQKKAHAIAVAHGWWDKERTFGDCIALVHSELSEALEAYREHGLTSGFSTHHARGCRLVEYGYGDCDCNPTYKPEGVASELADVVIRVADMAEWYGVGLEAHVESGVGAPETHIFGRWFAFRELAFGEWVGMAHYWAAEAFKWGVQYEADGVAPNLAWQSLGYVIAVVQRMAAHYGIDLDAAIEAKMEYNRTRQYRHGGKAL